MRVLAKTQAALFLTVCAAVLEVDIDVDTPVEGAQAVEVKEDGSVSLLQIRTPSKAPKLEEWEKCADEGQMLPVAERVRYGLAMSWVESSVAGGRPCVLSTFGVDVMPGASKVCDCYPSTARGAGVARMEMGLLWTRCAGEGEMCECASGAVRFGNGMRWAFTDPAAASVQAAAPPTHCGPEGFGGLDPARGMAKECWCQKPSDDGPTASARVAVVMLSRRPPSFKTWLEYHLNHMGVERVFIQVEDTPDFKATWDTIEPALQQRVELWPWKGETGTDSRPADDYVSLMDRQLHAMQRAKDRSAELGIEWLMHIDDDELLYTQPYRRIGDILAAMPADLDQAFVVNVEAVIPSADVENCFLETKEINVNPFVFTAYTNGKAAIRVANREAIPAGPHTWGHVKGEYIPSMHTVSQPFGSPVYVVHFESCPFTRWQDKFWELGNASPEQVKNIPFPFYSKSIELMQMCRANQSGPAGEAAGPANVPANCTDQSLREFWSSWKTKANPALTPRDVIPLRLNWPAA